MRRLLAAVAAATLLTSCSSTTQADPPESRALPAVTLDGLEGGSPLDLAAVRGPAVLNFWASWCAPCRDELPILEAFHRAHPEITMIGINYLDAQSDEAVDLARRSGLTYPSYVDGQGVLSANGPFPNLRGLPYTALVDAGGELVHGEFVEITSVEQLVDLVTEHLESSP